jgi:hypothetical protein
MGASCSLDLVNLYAFYHEIQFLTQTTQTLRTHYAEAVFLLANIRFFRLFSDDIELMNIFSINEDTTCTSRPSQPGDW